MELHPKSQEIRRCLDMHTEDMQAGNYAVAAAWLERIADAVDLDGGEVVAVVTQKGGLVPLTRDPQGRAYIPDTIYHNPPPRVVFVESNP